MAGPVADFGSFVITGIWLYWELKRLDSETNQKLKSYSKGCYQNLIGKR